MLVELLAAIAVAFTTQTLADWFYQLALITAVVLPACLLWLMLACQQKKQLQRCSTRVQYLAGAALGVLCNCSRPLGLSRPTSILEQCC